MNATVAEVTGWTHTSARLKDLAEEHSFEQIYGVHPDNIEIL